jgi:hypothetical protein
MPAERGSHSPNDSAGGYRTLRFGHWVQPPRLQTKGLASKPRWMPLPQLCYAQVIKIRRRRRLVRVCHRVVFGTLDGVQQGLAMHGW